MTVTINIAGTHIQRCLFSSAGVFALGLFVEIPLWHSLNDNDVSFICLINDDGVVIR